MKLKQSEIEVKGLVMAVLVTIVICVGGIVEIVPLIQTRADAVAIPEVKPYTPLELEGRDIYIREGCYLCHSQQVRPFRDETERYGPYSKAGESVYDHPFQWGSKRTGPDLARVGGKYPDSWHYMHMRNPRDVVPESIMPNYSWLIANKLDLRYTAKKMEVLRNLGVPYTDAQIADCQASIAAQAEQITGRLRAAGVAEAQSDREIVALIAYLQRLGMDIGWRNKVGAR
jgi:cytochrome c oxidase cbb3-type subunit I/II